jgi:malate dehydrogenase (oxaloacetate-decarboxylating)
MTMQRTPSPSYSVTLRLSIANRIGMFANIATAIGKAGGDLGAVEIIAAEKDKVVRDVTVNARDEDHEREIIKAIESIDEGVKVISVIDRTFGIHKGGKIEVVSKVPIRTQADFSRVYTPGVGRICQDIYHDPEHAYNYTIKGNAVAIITDGTAVLGFGNLGPKAALPVMEGKAMIFKEFAGIDAFPLCLDTTDAEEIIRTVKILSPAFGAINLEDISAPRCFEIERRLMQELDIPVIHDDQHGTATVVLAAMINVGRLLRQDITTLRYVVAGAGASATATTKLLLSYGVKDIVVCDREGAIFEGRDVKMDQHKAEISRTTNPRNLKGKLSDVIAGANVFLGLSGPNIVTSDDIARMAPDAIVFALANPDPEIAPEDAKPLVRIMATGRSDYPNQVNNALSYPGIFRGLIDARARGVNDEIRFAAAKAIAYLLNEDELNEENILPSAFDRRVVAAVADAVATAAKTTGLSEK